MTDNFPRWLHKKEVCVGPCPYHAPSDHHMVEWPKVLRETGLIERVCSHGIGHPDPDSVRFFISIDLGYAYLNIHGCDGCCGGE